MEQGTTRTADGHATTAAGPGTGPADDLDRKRRRAARVQKHLVNPCMRPLIRAGLLPSLYALVETTGRRTGQPRVVPVGYGRDGDTLWVVAEGGTGAAYVRNLVADPRVRVRIGRRWRTGTATLVHDDNAWARRRSIDAGNGLLGRLDGILFRSNATTPATVRIALDPS